MCVGNERFRFDLYYFLNLFRPFYKKKENMYEDI